MLIGTFGVRVARTTSEFYVASRSVRPALNAAAISGEYLSAASFLGIAGLLLVYGTDMLWYPFGFTAGYLVLLLVAAPLRRSGAYTLPDFAEARLGSVAVRRIAAAFVVVVGWLYLIPQLQGAGLTLGVLTGAPHWLGGLLVGVVVFVIVASGGMRSITFVQIFQFWLKFTALLVPLVFLLLAWQSHGSGTLGLDRPLQFHSATRVSFGGAEDLTLTAPVRVTATGVVDGRHYADQAAELTPGRHHLDAATTLTFPAGAAVPVSESVANGGVSSSLASGPRPHPLYSTYSLIIATLLGTVGLPHVVVRFYTSPNGVAARRTTVAVLGLIGAFYLMPPLYGALARAYLPGLTLTGDADAAVLELPVRAIGGVPGQLLAALLAAGAFAAFLATASGLTMAVTGVLTQHLPKRKREANWWVRRFRWAAALAMAVPAACQALVGDLPVADSVGLAFALAAAAFSPLLLLGIWWPRLTAPGAIAGMLVGGGAALVAIALTITGVTGSGWLYALLSSPAVWTVALGLFTTVTVSLATRHRIPPGTGAFMTRLHTPEGLSAHSSPAVPGARR